MLPDHVYRHYYYHDRPCEFCEDMIQIDDIFQCESCYKDMCEDCIANDCYICNDEEKEGVDGHSWQMTCIDCMQYCKECNVAFHENCRKFHQKECNPLARAQRRAIAATKDLVDLTEKMTKLKRQFEYATEELQQAQAHVKRIKKMDNNNDNNEIKQEEKEEEKEKEEYKATVAV